MKSPIHPFPLLAIVLCVCFVTASRPAPAQSEAAPPAANDTNAFAGTNAAATLTTAPPTSVMETPNDPEPYRRSRQRHPVFFNDYILETGITNYGDAVTLKGSSTVNGALSGSSVTVFGDARVNGTLGRDLIVIMGSARLGPEARIGGDLVVLGGKLQGDAGAKVRGGIVEVDPEKIPGLPGALAWIMQGLLLGRPLTFGVGWVWLVAGVFLLLNLLVLLMFPGSIQNCLTTMEKRPIGSFFSGTLAIVLSGLLAALLIITIVGIIVLPFLVLAMLVAFVFGKIAVYRYVGQRLGHSTGLAFLAAPAVALLLGTAVFYLLYAVPVLGFVGWGFTSIFGVGAAMMAGIQKFRGEQRVTPAVSIPASVTPMTSAEGTVGSPQPTAASVSPLEASLLPHAGFWIRLFATALDFVLFLIIMAILQPRHPELVLILWGVYHVVLWTWRGATIGGIIVGVRVVRTDGGPLSFMLAILRALASIFSAAALGLGFFWAGFSGDKQSWHDKISGTVIVTGR